MSPTAFSPAFGIPVGVWLVLFFPLLCHVEFTGKHWVKVSVWTWWLWFTSCPVRVLASYMRIVITGGLTAVNPHSPLALLAGAELREREPCFLPSSDCFQDWCWSTTSILSVSSVPYSVLVLCLSQWLLNLRSSMENPMLSYTSTQNKLQSLAGSFWPEFI